MASQYKSGIFGWVSDAMGELRNLMEKAHANEEMAVGEASEHIEEAIRKLEFAQEEEDYDQA